MVGRWRIGGWGGGKAGDGGWKEGVEMELSEEDVMKRLKEGWYENGLKNIHTDIHTYIHTHIHTHTYTHTHTNPSQAASS